MNFFLFLKMLQVSFQHLTSEKAFGSFLSPDCLLGATVENSLEVLGQSQKKKKLHGL